MSTLFYAAIGRYYDDIFPLDCDMADFLTRHLPRGLLLDIGCATGLMALHLARMGFAVHGFDADPEMIAIAEARAAAATLPAAFAVRDMRDLQRSGKPGSFAGAYCVGNTLVHLGDEGEIARMLQAVRQLLAPAGALAVQIINYDRVLDAGVTELPERDTDLLRFTRHYRRNNSHIEFNTSLTLKASGATLENSIMLLPLRAATLEGLLLRAGFSSVRLFADFADAPWSPDGYLTVALARA